MKHHKDFDFTPEEIETMVLQYKENKDQKIILLLLKSFEPLLKKYFLLSTKKKAYFDDGAKAFIASVTNGLYLKGVKNENELKRFVNIIADAYRLEEPMDIKQDLNYVFIKLINNYEPKGSLFVSYINYSFPYEFGRIVKNRINGPTINNAITIGSYDNYIDKKVFIEPPDDGIDEFGYLTEKWPALEPDMNVFNVLTAEERELLMLYYQDLFNDKQLSDLMNVHINTVNQKRRHAVAKLEKVLGIKAVRARVSGQKNNPSTIVLNKHTNKDEIKMKNTKSLKQSEEVIVEGTRGNSSFIKNVPCQSCIHIKICKHTDHLTKAFEGLYNISVLKEEFNEREFELKVECKNFIDTESYYMTTKGVKAQ